MDKNKYAWEEDLISPILNEQKNNAWMNRVEKSFLTPKKVSSRLTLIGSIVLVVLAIGIFTQNESALKSIFSKSFSVSTTAPTNVPDNTSIEISKTPPANIQKDQVNYPPHNKVFENQDQLSNEQKTKAEFIQKMAYAYQNFKTLRGKVEVNSNNVVTKVDIQLREGKNPASYEASTDPNGIKSEYTNDNHYNWTRTNGKDDKVRRVSTRDPERQIPGPFLVIDKDGIQTFSPPDDPAFSQVAVDIVSPIRNMSTMLSEGMSLWSIMGEETLLDRKVQMVEGNLDAYHASKGNVRSYKLWVDDETGMVLKNQFYDQSGTIVESLEVTSIELNTALDEKIFDIPQELKK